VSDALDDVEVGDWLAINSPLSRPESILYAQVTEITDHDKGGRWPL
jgi:hypothetical protein